MDYSGFIMKKSHFIALSTAAIGIGGALWAYNKFCDQKIPPIFLKIKKLYGVRANYYKSHIIRTLQTLEQHTKYMHFVEYSAIESMLFNLAILLDEICVTFLDNVFKSDLQNSLVSRDLHKVQTIEEFYKKHPDLINNNSMLKANLESIVDNFMKQSKILFNRVNNDFAELVTGFFQSNQLKLINIKSVGSDLHHQGAQVLILGFSLNKLEEIKIVYKPSSVEADTYIIGNINRLKDLDSRYIEKCSFIEILNEELLKESRQPLPTYLIIPKEDRVEENLTDDPRRIYKKYGYLQYISHRPWEEIDIYGKMLKLSRNKHELNHSDITCALESYYTQEHTRLLKKAYDSGNCEYILINDEEANNYSYASGCLIAIMLMLGVVDMHVENMIVSKKLPVLLDLENSFRIDEDEPTIQKTLVLHRNRGSMSHKSTIPKSYSVLFNIGGKQSVQLEEIGKNRAYLYEKEGSCLKAFKIREDSAISGLNDTFKICANKRELFSQWVKSVENICVRYIPFNTPQFIAEIDRARLLIMENIPAQFYEFKQNLLTAKPHDCTSDSSRINNYSIYNEETIDEYISEISTGNVPVYYIFLNNNALFDFKGTQLEPAFFSETPYEHIMNRFYKFIEDSQYVEKYKEELRNMLSKLDRQSELTDTFKLLPIYKNCLIL